ncbi:hypothetical protein MCEMRE249_00434 [Candidatus Nanopelagicaceae bacterium]
MRKTVALVLVIAFLSPLHSVAAVKAGDKCSKLNATSTNAGKKFTCIKSGNKLIWNKGVKVTTPAKPAAAASPAATPEPTASPSPSPSAKPDVVLPVANTACPRVGMKIEDSRGYLKCIWQGGARGKIADQIFWRYFPVTKLSTTKSNNYQTKPVEKGLCERSGDTFDIDGGILECRWINGHKLQWIRINTVKKTFVNAKSPVSIDVCKLQNSASNVDRSGRNAGAGMVGFPLTETNKNGMNLTGNNEVLIVPLDFSDFRGEGDPSKQIAYDTKWLKDWYRYFSNGKTNFNVTSFDRWIHMPGPRDSYPTDAKSSINANANQMQGNQAQAFINEISKEIDLRKFSTVYIFYPEGEYTMNDLIVRNHLFKFKEGEKTLNLFSWGSALEAMETPKWSYYIHETLHDFNIIGHAPGNGWPLGIMTSQSGIGLAINPWEQFLFDWLPSDQIYCDVASSLKTATISLTPVEREDKQTKMAVIKLSPTRAIVVESHGVDKWSTLGFGDRAFPAGFYSVMAYVVDLDKTVAPPVRADGTSLSNDDWAWAVWEKVSGQLSNEFYMNVGDQKDLAGYVAVLGDSFVIEGVKIKFVGTGDYETIEISKA